MLPLSRLELGARVGMGKPSFSPDELGAYSMP